MYTTSYPSAILKKLKFSWHIFEKYYQISWKSVQWEQSCSMWKDGRKDRHDEAKSNFSEISCLHPKKVLSQLEM
jgi:hypothetical protein